VNETERVRRLYDRIAERYDRAERWERRLFGADARGLVREAQGDVLELAVGTGRNLELYPPQARVTGIELSGGMLERARSRARDLGRDVDLRQGDAQALPFPEAAFDTVVCTFSLCTIPDERRALAEARRVLRPGGLLLLVEHVRSPNPLVRLLERLAEPVMSRIAGDHLLRDPLDHLEGTGFRVEHVERSRLGVLERVRARAV
jgi:ubiquinone/menaquinone biosynthesis C-methylase UbiE